MGKIPYEATSVIVEQFHSLIQSYVEDLEDTIDEMKENLKKADIRIAELETQLAISNEFLRIKEEEFCVRLQNKMDLV